MPRKKNVEEMKEMATPKRGKHKKRMAKGKNKAKGKGKAKPSGFSGAMFGGGPY